MNCVSLKDLNAPGVIEISSGRLYVVQEMKGRRSEGYDFPIRFDLAAVVLCHKGSADVVMNDLHVTLQRDEILFITPGSIMESFRETGSDCEISIIMSSAAERFRSVMIDRQLWDLMVRVRRHPVIRITEEEKGIELANREMLTQILGNRREGDYTDLILSSLTDVFLYQMLNVLSKRFSYQNRTGEKLLGSRAFMKFLDILQESDGKMRSVEEMARRLSVSPKYLARIVKENSGMTPSEWMDEYTMRAIIHELRHTDKAMKDIALSMGFPNPSSFGTFFRKHEGISPAAYRAKYL